MKEIDNVKYFNIADICEAYFHNRIDHNELRDYFEAGKIDGRKIENEWHADEKAIDEFINNVYLKDKGLNVGPYKLDLSDIQLEGRILDIGGGGEGVIGQFKGKQVVAIDPNRRELEEAPSTEDLKIVMNAKDLKFLDNTFDTATAFFTLMYIPKNNHKKIFQEIYRVLKSHGEFVVWDVKIPKKDKERKDLFMVWLEVQIGDTMIDTGYGTRWNKQQDMDYYLTLGNSVGFKVLESKEEQNTFYIRFRKI